MDSTAVTSHLTVSSSSGTAAVGSAPGLTSTSSSTANTGKESVLGAFGAILEALQAGIAAALPTGTVAAGSKATGFTTPSPANTANTQSDSPNGQADAAANATALMDAAAGNTVTAPLVATAGTADGAAPNDAGTPPKLLKDLTSALAELDKVEQSGGTPDQDLLKRVKKAVDAVATYLNAQPQLAPAPAPPATDSGSAATSPIAAAGSTAPAAAPDTAPDPTTQAGSDAADALSSARDIVSKLDDKLTSLATATAKVDPDLSARLANLAKTFDPKSTTADTLSQLGLNASEPTAQPDLTQAINALAATKTAPAVALQPALAAPQLKLPQDSALSTTDTGTAKSSDKGHTLSSAPASSVAPSPTADKNGTGSTSADNSRSDDRKPAETEAVGAAKDARQAAATAPATSRTDDTSVATQPQTTTATPVAAAAKTAQTAYQTGAASQVNLPQMAYEIARHVQQGTSHFQIRLDPADLGRVDVKMSVDATGGVSAQMTVERPETLDLLRRDASQLSQAFTQAGLDGAKTSMQFSLSQNPFTRQDNPQGQNSGAYTPADEGEDSGDIAAVASLATSVYRGTASASGLNLFV